MTRPRPSPTPTPPCSPPVGGGNPGRSPTRGRRPAAGGGIALLASLVVHAVALGAVLGTGGDGRARPSPLLTVEAASTVAPLVQEPLPDPARMPVEILPAPADPDRIDASPPHHLLPPLECRPLDGPTAAADDRHRPPSAEAVIALLGARRATGDARQRTRDAGAAADAHTAGPSGAIGAGTPPRSEPTPATPDPTNRAPVYPDRARDRGWQGTVRLRVRVGLDGTVDAVEVLASSGYGTLDRAAERAVRRWRFRPAERDGSPESSWVTQTIRFRLEVS